MNRRQFVGAGMVWPFLLMSPPVRAAAKLNEDVSTVDEAALNELLTLSLPDLKGTAVSLRDLADGRLTVLNFWASWCAPCVREMPALDALHQKQASVNVVGIGLDTVANIEAFARKTPVSYPLLTAGAGKIALMRRLGNPKGGLPFTLVLDEKAGPLATILGEIAMDELAAFANRHA
ncbi:TlpA family protein disulfide reductase [Advenella mimigardefordensis]|uniref:Putative thioredoxin-like fold domain-containing protein n=1 Tax=Advenella mimigardefordensis (strain DSM 17166 / LMG 22922 / DPN7) TaxID=1247726 RepID=W0PDR2_ADVMD|nr:TlpA disulfide reductase family protein [Advenella mimigardefordensis]AHG65009.1 putative thioredoxin-like fold domain-containing protein [Advenella mimigardefordensis DPN7]